MVRFVFRLKKPSVTERFARQYRYEHPLEILLTLPFSRCVHNLSGPNTCAHFQDHRKYTYTLLPWTVKDTATFVKKNYMTVLCLSVLCPCCGSGLVWKQATAHSTGTPDTPKKSNRSKLFIPATKKSIRIRLISSEKRDKIVQFISGRMVLTRFCGFTVAEFASSLWVAWLCCIPGRWRRNNRLLLTTSK